MAHTSCYPEKDLLGICQVHILDRELLINLEEFLEYCTYVAVLSFEVQVYLEAKGQRNKVSGRNTYLVLMNNGSEPRVFSELS